MSKTKIIKLIFIPLAFIFTLNLQATDPIDQLIEAIKGLESKMGGLTNMSDNIAALEETLAEKTELSYIASASSIFAGLLASGLVVYQFAKYPIKKLMSRCKKRGVSRGNVSPRRINSIDTYGIEAGYSRT